MGGGGGSSRPLAGVCVCLNPVHTLRDSRLESWRFPTSLVQRPTLSRRPFLGGNDLMKWREHAIDVQNIERDSNEAERYASISTSDETAV